MDCWSNRQGSKIGRTTVNIQNDMLEAYERNLPSVNEIEIGEEEMKDTKENPGCKESYLQIQT